MLFLNLHEIIYMKYSDDIHLLFSLKVHYGTFILWQSFKIETISETGTSEGRLTVLSFYQYLGFQSGSPISRSRELERVDPWNLCN